MIGLCAQRSWNLMDQSESEVGLPGAYFGEINQHWFDGMDK